MICSASGHLYGLADGTANRSVYPVLDLEWMPIAKNSRAARLIKVISELAKDASSFIHACDYDQEGEVIGHSILEYGCGGKYAKSLRAKFSTLTEEDIRNSFANLIAPSPELADAGRARHMLDFIYGVNLSRALARSFKTISATTSLGGYRNLSIGRVQGPALAFAVGRELEIKSHLPDPYWIIDAKFRKGSNEFSAAYVKPRLASLAEAKSILKECTAFSGTVFDVRTSKAVLRPPTPFNVGDLQHEAHRLFRISPGYTLAIAEKLYLQALISYPRTSSQKLPPSIGYAKIISDLSKIGSYAKLTLLLSMSKLVPNEGSMTDPAHPAIYPTGKVPQTRLGGLEFKVYDLIVKRFLATFGDPSVSRVTQVAIDVRSHEFRSEASSSLYEGWMVFYRPYVNIGIGRSELPVLNKGDLVENMGIEMQEKFTHPAPRYNQASLLAKMEHERIGTKATRADIIATLFKRNYLATSRAEIEVTALGIAVIESMTAFVPAIVSTELTRSMEEQLERVETGSTDSRSAIEEAVDKLIESLSTFMKNELDIGSEIIYASAADRSKANIISTCPVCKKGQLRVIRSFRTKKRFVGCTNYAAGQCRASAPLPKKGSVRSTGKTCQECQWPIVAILFARGAKHWRICINPACPSKKTR